MTVIKICGLASAEEALAVAGASADIIGLVLAPSPRRISIETAAEIVRAVKQLPSPPAIAGVFVNQPANLVNGIAATCRLDIVQLSGDESWDYCRDLQYPFFNVIHVKPGDTYARVSREMEAGYCTGQRQPLLGMLDCRSSEVYGGSGHSFDWDIAAGACARFPLIIAGGLSPSNVRQLIRLANPAGVDVSSGVESDGHKDMDKVRDFIRAVRLTGGRGNHAGAMTKILCKGERYAAR